MQFIKYGQAKPDVFPAKRQQQLLHMRPSFSGMEILTSALSTALVKNSLGIAVPFFTNAFHCFAVSIRYLLSSVAFSPAHHPTFYARAWPTPQTATFIMSSI
jgi:hypothetical protein